MTHSTLLLALAALTLSACARQSPPQPVDAWLPTVPGSLSICLPAPSMKLNRSEREAWQAAVTAARSESTRDQAVPMLEAGLEEGPVRDQAQWVLELHAKLTDPKAYPDYDPQPASQGMLAAAELAPDDACLQYTTGLLAGIGGQDVEPYLARAVELLPDHPAPTEGLLLVQARSAAGPDFDQRLADAAERFPASGLIQSLHAMRLLMDQRYAEALPHLQAAEDAGVAQGDLIFSTSRMAGDLDRYLRMASERGLPLGDGGALASAASPERAFAELLGVGEDGALTATIETSQGTLTCALLWRDAPVTVGNFVGLVRGTQPFTDPESGEPVTRRYYDGTVLHRVIPEFMIQGGDPTGTGSGGPGYRFLDETHPDRRFDRPGLLAMANAGPGTNGSQFFITEVAVPHLNGRHTIFGECDEASVEVVKAIARVPTDASDKPQGDVVVERIAVE